MRSTLAASTADRDGRCPRGYPPPGDRVGLGDELADRVPPMSSGAKRRLDDAARLRRSRSSRSVTMRSSSGRWRRSARPCPAPRRPQVEVVALHRRRRGRGSRRAASGGRARPPAGTCSSCRRLPAAAGRSLRSAARSCSSSSVACCCVTSSSTPCQYRGLALLVHDQRAWSCTQTVRPSFAIMRYSRVVHAAVAPDRLAVGVLGMHELVPQPRVGVPVLRCVPQDRPSSAG